MMSVITTPAFMLNPPRKLISKGLESNLRELAVDD